MSAKREMMINELSWVEEEGHSRQSGNLPWRQAAISSAQDSSIVISHASNLSSVLDFKALYCKVNKPLLRLTTCLLANTDLFIINLQISILPITGIAVSYILNNPGFYEIN